VTKRKPTIVTRQEAARRGLLRYFTGKPCKRGHVVERFVSTATCIECGLISSRHYQRTPKGHASRRRYKLTNKYLETMLRHNLNSREYRTEWQRERRLNEAIEAARNSTNPDRDQARLASLLARRLKDGR